MATSQADAKDRQFLAVIGDEVSFILRMFHIRQVSNNHLGLRHRTPPRRHWRRFRMLFEWCAVAEILMRTRQIARYGTPRLTKELSRGGQQDRERRY